MSVHASEGAFVPPNLALANVALSEDALPGADLPGADLTADKEAHGQKDLPSQPPESENKSRVALTRTSWMAPTLIMGCATAALGYVELNNPTDNQADPLSGCAFKYLTGYDCPGCGGTRMVWYAMHGDVMGALQHHMVAFLLIPFFSICICTVDTASLWNSLEIAALDAWCTVLDSDGSRLDLVRDSTKFTVGSFQQSLCVVSWTALLCLKLFSCDKCEVL